MIAAGVGRVGVEISPPGNFFFFLRTLVGGGEVLRSIVVTSKPCLLAYSFSVWPAFPPGICSVLAHCDQFIFALKGEKVEEL